MSSEDNKRLVTHFFNDLSAGNASGAFDALADSATWWIQGNFPLSGTKTEAEFMRLAGDLMSKIDGGLTVKVTGMTAEGDRVAAEAESFARMKNGKTYQNRYHFLCVVRDGKIQSVREYLDTMHATRYSAADAVYHHSRTRTLKAIGLERTRDGSIRGGQGPAMRGRERGLCQEWPPRAAMSRQPV